MTGNAILDYQRAALALLRALLGDDQEGAEAVMANVDLRLLVLTLCAQFNSVGEREAGSREQWDAYLAARLAEMPPG